MPSGRLLEPEVQGGRFPSTSGASGSDAHNSATLGCNQAYDIGSQNLQPGQTPQGVTLNFGAATKLYLRKRDLEQVLLRGHGLVDHRRHAAHSTLELRHVKPG